MKTACSILFLICSSAMMAQSVHLSVPAVDASNNAVTIGMAYFTWGQFAGNDGITVQAGQLTRPVTNGTIDVTLAASDNAGYVYTLLLMHGSTADTFKWRVPAAGVATMAELNQPPATNNDSTTVHTNEASIYTAGKKQTFSASGTTAGEASAGVSADPSAAMAGDRWFRTDLHHMRIHDGTTARSVMYQSDSLPANQLTNPAAETSLLFAANPFNVTFGSSTGSGNMMSILDTPGNTGTGYVFTAGTASGSSAKPFQVLAGGVKVIDVNAAGAITLGPGSTNVSALQLTTASGNTSPNLDYKNATVGAPAAFWETAWRNNEAGRADFGLGLGYFSPSNGAVHRDNVLSYGYNCGGGTSKQLSSDHAFCMRIESDYTTSESIRQLEFYFDYFNAANTVNYRPFSITPHLDTDTVDVATLANRTIFGSADTSNNWLEFDSTATSGTMQFLGNSTIQYVGSNTDWLQQNGQPLIGFEQSSGSGRIFPQITTYHYGSEVGGTSGVSFLFTVGLTDNASHNRGIRWDAPSQAWQYQVDNTTWRAFNSQTLDQIGNPATAKTFTMGSNPLTVTYGSTTSTANMMTVQDTASNTGTGYVFTAGTASGSSAKPFQVLASGVNAMDVSSAGAVTLGATGTTVNARGSISAAVNVSAGNAFYFPSSSLLMQANSAQGDSGNAYLFADTTGSTTRQIQASSLWIGATRNGTRLGGFDPNGSATVAGLQTAVSRKTANYTATSNDTSLPCDASAGNVVVTLPAAPKTGEWKAFKKVDSSSNTCTYSGNGKNIEGASTLVYSTQYQHGMAQYDGTQWWLY